MHNDYQCWNRMICACFDSYNHATWHPSSQNAGIINLHVQGQNERADFGKSFLNKCANPFCKSQWQIIIIHDWSIIARHWSRTLIQGLRICADSRGSRLTMILKASSSFHFLCRECASMCGGRGDTHSVVFAENPWTVKSMWCQVFRPQKKQRTGAQILPIQSFQLQVCDYMSEYAIK